MKKNGPEFFTLTALVKNRPIKFIMDSGSPVTLIPKLLFNRITPLKPVETEYRDVIDNRIRFEGKYCNSRNKREARQPRSLGNNKETQPFTRLGLDEEFGNNAGYRYDRFTDKPYYRRSGHNNPEKKV